MFRYYVFIAACMLLSLSPFTEASAVIMDATPHRPSYTTAGGFDWLDFTDTSGLSIAKAQADFQSFRLPTAAEIDVLWNLSFESLPIPTLLVTSDAGFLASFTAWRSLFGVTFDWDGVLGSYARYLNEDGLVRWLGGLLLPDGRAVLASDVEIEVLKDEMENIDASYINLRIPGASGELDVYRITISHLLDEEGEDGGVIMVRDAVFVHVPEPSPLSLMVLGFGALIVSRQWKGRGSALPR